MAQIERIILFFRNIILPEVMRWDSGHLSPCLRGGCAAAEIWDMEEGFLLAVELFDLPGVLLSFLSLGDKLSAHRHRVC